jgi:hypothetical protein
MSRIYKKSIVFLSILALLSPIIALGVDVKSLSGVYSTATSTFLTTVGFAYVDISTWSNTMISFVLGSWLGIMSVLVKWVIAILVVFVIMSVGFTGFRLIKH